MAKIYQRWSLNAAGLNGVKLRESLLLTQQLHYHQLLAHLVQAKWGISSNWKVKDSQSHEKFN